MPVTDVQFFFLQLNNAYSQSLEILTLDQERYGSSIFNIWANSCSEQEIELNSYVMLVESTCLNFKEVLLIYMSFCELKYFFFN